MVQYFAPEKKSEREKTIQSSCLSQIRFFFSTEREKKQKTICRWCDEQDEEEILINFAATKTTKRRFDVRNLVNKTGADLLLFLFFASFFAFFKSKFDIILVGCETTWFVSKISCPIHCLDFPSKNVTQPQQS